MIATMRSRQIDGFILATRYRDSPGAVADLGGLPIVLVNRRARGNDLPSVTPDNAEGESDAAVGFLHDRGHTKIAHLAGPQDMSTGWERHRGFLAAMNARGVEVDQDRIYFCDAFTEEAGFRGCSEILDRTGRGLHRNRGRQ